MSNETGILASKYEPMKCAGLIEASIDTEGSTVLTASGNKPFLGIVEGLNFRIHKRINYRNGFQTYLFGTIKPSGDGSLISCRSGISTAARVALGAVTLVALSIGGWNTYSVFHRLFGRGVLTQGEWVGLVVPIVMCCFIWIVYFLGRLIASKEKAALIEFLEEKLGATR